MEQPASSSNSSSFEDLAKDQNEINESEKDDGFMDILGNNHLTKKVGQSFHFTKFLSYCFY